MQRGPQEIFQKFKIRLQLLLWELLKTFPLMKRIAFNRQKQVLKNLVKCKGGGGGGATRNFSKIQKPSHQKNYFKQIKTALNNLAEIETLGTMEGNKFSYHSCIIIALC